MEHYSDSIATRTLQQALLMVSPVRILPVAGLILTALCSEAEAQPPLVEQAQRIASTVADVVVGVGGVPGQRGVVGLPHDPAAGALTLPPLNPIDILSGPVVERFEQAGYRIVDQADKQLNSTLANKLAEAKTSLAELLKAESANLVTLVAQTTDESLVQLDDVLKKNLDEADAKLQSSIGALHTTGRIFVDALTSSLRILALLIVTIAFVGAVALDLQSVNSGKPMLERFRERRTAVFLGAWVFAMVTIWASLALFDLYRLNQYHKELHDRYTQSFVAFDFARASYFSRQLETLESDNPYYQGLTGKADLFRAVFGNPARAKTVDGLRALEALQLRVSDLFDRALTFHTIALQLGSNLCAEAICV